jgi:alkanesulfonate monooxygenase SsuD/methylene tetrahydromethanopterin reductase-like flavin-dependent oxidoreductase (luciferase family)
VRLVPSILLAPLYHPVMLAKLTATLDIASGGRLTLGVGVGGEYPVEFEAMGVPVQERGARMNEVLRLLKRLWTEEHVTNEGRFYPLNDVTLLPRPLQQPHPPIWVAGRREAAMRRAVRYGDGWLPYFYSPERYRDSVERITAIAKETNRDLSGFQWAHYAFISIYDSREEAARLGGRYSSRADMASIIGQYAILGTVADCIRRMEEYIEAGARYFTFTWSCKPEDVDRHIETVTREIIPYFRGH